MEARSPLDAGSPLDASQARLSEVVLWATVNIALLVVFSLLLAFDDRIARAAGL